MTLTGNDRSQELYALFNDFKGNPASSSRSGASSHPTVSLSAPHSTSEVQTFNRFAQSFASHIAGISETIARLTKLTQRRDVFQDQTQEIGTLTQTVKNSLQRLHSDLDTLEELKRRAIRSCERSRAPATSSGSDGFFKSGAHLATTERHSDAVVETLKKRLARTGQDFRNTLQQQSQSMINNANRRNLYTNTDKPQAFESALFQDEEQQQLQQQQLVAGTGNVQYYRQRAEVVREIEAAVAEVGELFNDFTRLVHEQDEVILRIDADVDTAVDNVTAGGNELMRYLANLSSNRGLILKIFAMLFFLLLFFGIFVVR